MSSSDFSLLLDKIHRSFEELSSESEQLMGPPSFVVWVNEAVSRLNDEEYALLLEALPMASRKRVFQCLPSSRQKDAFIEMQEESRRLLILNLEPEETDSLLNEFDAEALLELAEELPDRFITRAYEKLDQIDKQRFERGSKYSADMAGHWVNFNFTKVYSNLRVESAIRLIKRSKVVFQDSIYVVDRDEKLLGLLSIRDLLSIDPLTKIDTLLRKPETSVLATESMDTVADKVISSEYLSLPVIEDDGKMLGRMLLNTAYEHRDETKDQQIASAGGLTEDEDLFAPVWRSSKNRAVWLGINLLTAFLASWCIGLFEVTLQQVVALAILMPVVASMGGISGSQTLTVIVRALALGKITESNQKAVLKKELRVGIVNGILWAIIIGICVQQWFDQWLLGATIAIAILVNIIIAVLFGVLIPSALEKLKIDPALSGSVVLTTITDVVGFVVFLGVGALILT